MVSAITESDATHVNETAADTIIESFLTKKGDVIRNAQTQPSGLLITFWKGSGLFPFLM